jgi:hypothetical protein
LHTSAEAEQDALFASRFEPSLVSRETLPIAFASFAAVEDVRTRTPAEAKLFRPALQARWRDRLDTSETRVLASLIALEIMILAEQYWTLG